METNWLDKCFVVGSPDNKTMNLTERRGYSATIQLDPGKLWITGGDVNGDGVGGLISTDILSSNGTKRGPDLPTDVAMHCLVRLNSTTAMLIGGEGNGNGSGTWFFDFGSKTWSKGPDLKIPRWKHSCGVIYDTKNCDQLVVVTGGMNYGMNLTNSTEMWIVDSGEWISGPDYPYMIKAATELTFADDTQFLVIGGYSIQDIGLLSVIYKFECSNKVCQWTKMEQEMSMWRANHVSMLIPNSLTTCTPT